MLGTIDKPNFDSWEPLITLAGVAGVTERIRLATTILQLPPRNEVLVAKQAAVVDQLSGGRLTLGIAQGGREDDYEILGAVGKGRSARFEEQVRRIREIWANARTSDRTPVSSGQHRCRSQARPFWRGVDPVGDRACSQDRRRIPVRYRRQRGDAGAGAGNPGAFARNGKPDAPIVGLAYVGVGDDPDAALAEAPTMCSATTASSGRSRRT